ncbi:tetratricopeptide repeat protein [Massilia sp. TN1-12]|uniref:tetratricopeptide repeat protein n=1 Tax=Massilia paldalensis TaxID=3377675 RepID=UPI00384F3400
MPSTESLFLRARALIDERDVDGAATLLRAALDLDPGFAAAWANLGYALDAAGRKREAEDAYRRAIALDPHELQNSLNLGTLLTALRRLDAALDVYAAAIAHGHDAPALHSNLGMTLACAGREREAEDHYRLALARDPDHRKAPFNLAYLLLRQGRWEEGWRRLEARPWIDVLQRHFGMPRWQGGPLAGRRILVGVEGGHGDMIQFGRYAALLKEAGAARVGVLCQPELVALFGGLRGADESIALDRPLAAGDWDCWVAPLSLPLLFGTRVDSVPAAVPYLVPDAARVAQLAPLLAAVPGALKVGLAWKGNPRHENDAARSLPSLSVLAPLAAVKDVRWFSLQKGAGEGESVEGFAPVDLAPAIRDFADTAALVAGLDLVITVDTSVAHLAGAMGTPCWVLLPDYLPDWRWLAGRADTPWYPGMRLFRQRPGAGWDEVVVDVAQALETWP